MFRLGQAYPNPFNPTTNIEFSIPKSCDVRLEIYDLSGKIVRRLIDGVRYEPGVYKVTWDGTDDHGNRVASGVYIYRMTAGSYTSAKKVVFAK
jgi:flagellar hook assembly protein FlgD